MLPVLHKTAASQSKQEAGQESCVCSKFKSNTIPEGVVQINRIYEWTFFGLLSGGKNGIWL